MNLILRGIGFEPRVTMTKCHNYFYQMFRNLCRIKSIKCQVGLRLKYTQNTNCKRMTIIIINVRKNTEKLTIYPTIKINFAYQKGDHTEKHQSIPNSIVFTFILNHHRH